MFKHYTFLKIRTVLIIAFFIPMVGIFGYMLIEDYNFVDAFYMTTITVSTVGFQEVQPLSLEGRVFTAFLILFSFGTFAYAASVITTYVLSGEFQQYFKDVKVNKHIDKLDNHIIICGYGRNGQRAGIELHQHNKDYVVIEKNPELIKNAQLQHSFLFIEGDAKEDRILEKAGVDRAKALITTMPDDSDNLYVVLTARTLNKKLFIVSRASMDSAARKLKMAGADNVIMPDKIGGAHMAALTIKPNVIEFMDAIITQDANEVNVEEVNCEDLSAHLASKTVGELSSKITSGANIIGFKDPDGTYVINPSPDTKLISGARLFILGTEDQMQFFN